MLILSVGPIARRPEVRRQPHWSAAAAVAHRSRLRLHVAPALGFRCRLPSCLARRRAFRFAHSVGAFLFHLLHPFDHALVGAREYGFHLAQLRADLQLSPCEFP